MYYRFPSRFKTAFSLIEILLVIVLIVILGSLSVAGFQHVTGSRQMTAAASLVIDQLNFARQSAISQNAPVRFQICEIEDSRNGDEADFRLVRLQVFDQEGRIWKPLSRPQVFPQAIIASRDVSLSTMLAASDLQTISDLNFDGNSGRSVQARAIDFLPSGRPRLNPNAIYSLTVRHSGRGEDFITIQLDPVSGTSRIFRP